MKKINVYNQPLAANICDQMLREVDRNEKWSMAHVIMNPGAASLLHSHQKMAEIYIITRGSGELRIGNLLKEVKAGSVIYIPVHTPHQFFNTSATSLEHLVLAAPAFDPDDVTVITEEIRPSLLKRPAILPPFIECFDGAKIMPYEFEDFNNNLRISMAFGWSINDPERHKKPHYHKNTTEWMYVVEGQGRLLLRDDKDDEHLLTNSEVKAGDWIEILPGTKHALRNRNDEYLVVLCMCQPQFKMTDVHYK